MRVPAAAWLVLIPGIAGCGGSGGGGSVTVSIPSTAALDGTLTTGGTVTTDGLVLRVGDEDLSSPGSTVVSFLSFDLPAIPAQAQVTNAVLRLQIFNDIGQPGVGHGDVLADDVDIGATLDATDPVTVFASAVATVADDVSPVEVTLTARVAAAVAAGRTRFQLRMRYAIPSDSDGVNDWINYISADTTTPENAPVLAITYQP